MRRSALAVAVLALAWTGTASAQQKRPLVAEDLYRLRFASDVSVSPDGRSVVYVVSRADSAKDRYERALWIAAADGSSRRQLTYSEGDGAGSPAISPDGRTLAFVARREGDERAQIYLLPLDRPGEARRLTSLATGASGPVWSPDGKRIAFTSQLSPEALAGADSATSKEKKATTRRERLALAAEKGDPHVVTRLAFLAETGLSPERWGQIYVVDVENPGATPLRLTSGAYPHSSPAWSPDGKSIAYAARPPKGDYAVDYEQDGDLFLVASDGSGEPRNLTGKDAPPAGVKPLALPGPARVAAWDEQRPVFSPDGKRIAYSRSIVGENESAANNELAVLELAGAARHCVSCALDRSAGSAVWDPKTGDLLFTASDRGAVAIFRARPDGASAPKPVVSGPRGALSFDYAAGTLAWSQMDPSDPSEVYAAKADGSGSHELTQLNDSLLAAVHVQPYEEVWYRASDGTRIQGWVVRPPDFRPGMPLAVEMHGGPHAMWGPGEQSMWLEYQTLAGDGYVVFLSNPRGSDGYGFDWKKAIHDNWGELPMGDVLAGADTVLARGWADANRQYLTGGSYAGFLTAWIIGHSDRFKAAAAQRGVFNMTSWYGMANTWRLFESEFDAVPWEDHEKAWKASPLAYAKDMKTPLLILHGEEDRRVGMGGAEELYKALKVQGKEVEFVRYPREGHELTRSGEPRHRVDHMNRIVDWFDRHRPDLAGMKAAGTGN